MSVFVFVGNHGVYFHRRQKELEEKLIEEEVAKRVEELVAQRVEEELDKRKDEIEQEVLRRVEEAKRVMEKQMLEEMEKQRQKEMEAQKLKEVKSISYQGPAHGQSWYVSLLGAVGPKWNHVLRTNEKCIVWVQTLAIRCGKVY